MKRIDLLATSSEAKAFEAAGAVWAEVNKLRESNARLREALEELREWAGNLPPKVLDTLPDETFDKVNAALRQSALGEG